MKINKSLNNQIEKAIETQFNTLNKMGDDTYVFLGKTIDYLFPPYRGLKGINIIKSLNRKKIKLWEMGCACGNVIMLINNKEEDYKNLDVDVTALGFSATNYNGEYNPDYILIKDVHDLSKIPQLSTEEFKEPDIIISQASFFHFVHPAKPFLECLLRLKVGGFFIGDALRFKGLNCHEHTFLFQSLTAQGFQVVTSAEGEFFSDETIIIIQKTKPTPELKLPLIPVKVESNQVIYRLESPVLKQLVIQDDKLSNIDKLIKDAQSSLMNMVKTKGDDFCFGKNLLINLSLMIEAVLPLASYPLATVQKLLLENDDDFNSQINCLFTDKLSGRSKYLIEDQVYKVSYYYDSEDVVQKYKSLKISSENLVNHLIAMVHRDIKFHYEFVRFRNQLKSINFPIVQLEFSENMHKALQIACSPSSPLSETPMTLTAPRKKSPSPPESSPQCLIM